MTLKEATLVTGGSSGIGRAICTMLLDAGRTVVNLDYVKPDWHHPNLVTFQADLTDAAQTRERAQEIVSQYAITALVNNAGATRPGTIDTATIEDLDYVVALHFQASLILIRSEEHTSELQSRENIVCR